MKVQRILTVLTLSALAGGVAAQTPVFTEIKKVEEAPAPVAVLPLTITAVAPAQAARLDLLFLTGTGFERAEHVFVGGIEAPIVGKTPTGLTVLAPAGGHPGMWPVAVATRTERAESQVMYMPCVTVKLQDALWYEGHTSYKVVDNAYGVHVDSGVPGTFLVFASFSQRADPLVVNGYLFDFLLGDPYRFMGTGVIDESGSMVLQYHLPREIMGNTLYVQGLVWQNFGDSSETCFTNMEALELF